jgi:hypothetical protein
LVLTRGFRPSPIQTGQPAAIAAQRSHIRTCR